MEYGVNVTNKFAFLFDDDEEIQDPEEVLAKAKDKKKSEKAAVPVKSKTAVPVKSKETEPSKVVAAKSAVSSERQQRGADQVAGGKQPPSGRGPPRGGAQQNNGGSRRGGRNGDQQQTDHQPGDRKPPVRFQDNKDNRPPRKPRTERDENAPPRADGDHQRGPPRRDGDRNYDRGGNRGGDRGGRGRGGGGPGRGGPRRGPTKDNSQANAEQQEKTVEKSETTQQDAFPDTGAIDSWDVPPPAAKPDGENAIGDEAAADKPAGDIDEEVEPQQRVLTLEEWRQEHKKEEPQFKVRKAGEGGDTKIYQKLVPIKKDDEKKDHHDSEEELHVHKEKREKPVGIDVKFADSKRGGERGGRGDRGAPRGDRDGGRGGGGFRGPRRDGGDRNYNNNARSGPGPSGGRGGGGRQPADSKSFNLETEFPALGAH